MYKEEAEIGVGTSMKYLGLTLDSHWTFRAHFEATENALGNLLPRLDGPGVGVRRQYAGVVRSRFLYGAPIWAEDLMASRRSHLKVRRLHRTVDIRVVRGFPTISAVAAAVLVGFPPFELQALWCREIYLHTRGLREGVNPVGADVESGARRALLDRWRVSLHMRAGAPELRVLEVVLPNWDVWLEGASPPSPPHPLTNRVTQVLTGHGCFGEYLHRSRKEATARCHHWDVSVDSAQHTLEFCPAWAWPRRDLIAALLASERGRRAVTSFCEQIMLRREAAERARVRSSHSERIDWRGAADAAGTLGQDAQGPPLRC